jgi:hypothetical protein
MRPCRFLVLFALTVSACLAQSWEVGFAGGYSFYHNASITNPPLSASAGFQSGGAASAEFGQDVGRYIGGELRYTYLWGDAQLHYAGRQAALGADAQAIHYDILVYMTPKGSKVRPYVSAGGGIKYYMATGSESAAQPLGNFAFLTHTNQVEELLSLGAGVKAHIDEHWLFRVDFRYYLTPFPQQIFAPAAGSSDHGLLHNFVPMAGFDWTW